MAVSKEIRAIYYALLTQSFSSKDREALLYYACISPNKVGYATAEQTVKSIVKELKTR
jgi:hypothetical protein